MFWAHLTAYSYSFPIVWFTDGGGSVDTIVRLEGGGETDIGLNHVYGNYLMSSKRE
jgi:hypothetical protein